MSHTHYAGEVRRDIACAFRQFRKNPPYAAVAVLTLALGIGGTTAVFGIVDAVVLRPLPLDDPDRLLVVGESFQGSLSSMSVGNYVDAAAAAPGLVGVVAYVVGQRTQEIGVRIALGATTASVVRLMVGQAMRPVAIGAVIGLAAAAAATRVLASQLFSVGPTDPLTIAAVVVVLLGTAIVASIVPARHAATIDPTRARQSE